MKDFHVKTKWFWLSVLTNVCSWWSFSRSLRAVLLHLFYCRVFIPQLEGSVQTCWLRVTLRPSSLSLGAACWPCTVDTRPPASSSVIPSPCLLPCSATAPGGCVLSHFRKPTRLPGVWSAESPAPCPHPIWAAEEAKGRGTWEGNCDWLCLVLLYLKKNFCSSTFASLWS